MRRIERIIAHAAIGALLALCTIACNQQSEAPQAPPAKSQPPAEVSDAPEPAPPEPKPAAEDTAVPVAGGSADVEKGRASYRTFCASCHGPTGDGDGPAALGLDPKPARHSDGEYMNALSDDDLFQVIKFGGQSVGKSALMAPWGGALSDQQIRDVIAFIRSLAVPPYQP